MLSRVAVLVGDYTFAGSLAVNIRRPSIVGGKSLPPGIREYGFDDVDLNKKLPAWEEFYN
jgi:hypothetical protein